MSRFGNERNCNPRKNTLNTTNKIIINEYARQTTRLPLLLPDPKSHLKYNQPGMEF
jgi:hypothetical protein